LENQEKRELSGPQLRHKLDAAGTRHTDCTKPGEARPTAGLPAWHLRQ